MRYFLAFFHSLSLSLSFSCSLSLSLSFSYSLSFSLIFPLFFTHSFCSPILSATRAAYTATIHRFCQCDSHCLSQFVYKTRVFGADSNLRVARDAPPSHILMRSRAHRRSAAHRRSYANLRFCCKMTFLAVTRSPCGNRASSTRISCRNHASSVAAVGFSSSAQKTARSARKSLYSSDARQNSLKNSANY